MDNITISNNNSITTERTSKATIHHSFQIGKHILPIEITADFENIPPEMHEMFLQSIIYKYGL